MRSFFDYCAKFVQGGLGKMNGEDGFTFGGLAEIDVTAMLLCNLLSEGKSKPSAALSSLAYEGKKDFLSNVRRYPGAIVYDSNLNRSLPFD